MQFTIGVLALQGCVDRHKAHIEALSVKYREIKTKADLHHIDAYILPGGESSTMLYLLQQEQLFTRLQESLQHKPAWGICAGSILMASKIVEQEKKQASFGLIDMDVKRNGYGRHINSFQTQVNDYDVSFIRAPQIEGIGKDVTCVASYENKPVWVRSKLYMATTFHPELNSNYPSPMHQDFYEIIKSYYKHRR